MITCDAMTCHHPWSFVSIWLFHPKPWNFSSFLPSCPPLILFFTPPSQPTSMELVITKKVKIKILLRSLKISILPNVRVNFCSNFYLKIVNKNYTGEFGLEEPCYSVGAMTSSISVTWDIIGNAESRALSQTLDDFSEPQFVHLYNG